MRTIEIKNYLGCFSNCDLEDLPNELCAELVNLRPKNGRLVKTFGLGTLINTAITNTENYETTNLFTYIESNLTTPTGYAIILCEQHETDGTVKLHKWNGSSWANITLATTVYHRAGASYVNPVFQDSDILRFLPGACALVGSNAAKGLWYGYINRKYFDENYSPTAQFYDYETEPAKISYSWKVTEIGDTGISAFTADQKYYYRFTAIYDGVQESLLSDVFAFFRPTAANKYPVLQSEDITKTALNKRITAFKIYRSENANKNFSHIHTIDLQRLASEITSDTTGAYLGYNYAHIPDLSDFVFDGSKDYKLKIGGTLFFPIVNPETGTGAITEASTDNGGAKTNFVSNGHGLSAGDQIIITDTTSYNGTWNIDSAVLNSFVIVVAFVADEPGNWHGINSGYTIFEYDGYTNPNDMWNDEWELWELAGAQALEKDSNGCYTGEQSVIVSSTLEKGEFAGGLLQHSNILSGSVTVAATNDSGAKTEFTSTAHGLTTGNKVWLYGFTNSQYNGTFTVWSTTTNAFVLPMPFVTDDTGDWFHAGEVFRALDDNSERAVHFADLLRTGTANIAWQLLKAETGLYEWYSKGTVFCRFYDMGLDDGAPHPLEGETSIAINGRYVKVIGERLFQGYIYLDPGGANEEHQEWLSYSELGQLDVNPASNVKRMRDIEGGDITGIQEVFGNLVVLKEQMVAMLNMKDYPTIPENWQVIQSIHNIGNIAPRGSIEVQGNVYICFYDGIYRLRPNNLAPTDQTPTEVLKISEPIGDVYEALTTAGKKAIRAGYDQTKSEVIFRLSSTEVWAYSILTETWRQTESSKDLTFIATDEEANLIVYYDSDRKIYTLNEGDAKEAVSILYKSKTFPISNERYETVRRVVVTYKSTSPLLLRIYDPGEDIDTGDIQANAQYLVDGYTTLTYNSVIYHDGDIFIGAWGTNTYTTTGSGTVKTIQQNELISNTGIQKYDIAPRFNTKKCCVEISNGKWGILSADSTDDYFKVRGDQRNFLAVDKTFRVSGSAGAANDGSYTVTAVSYNKSTGETTVTVAAVPNDTDTGIIKITSSDATEVHGVAIEHD